MSNHTWIDNVIVPELIVGSEEAGEFLGGSVPRGDNLYIADFISFRKPIVHRTVPRFQGILSTIATA